MLVNNLSGNASDAHNSSRSPNKDALSPLASIIANVDPTLLDEIAGSTIIKMILVEEKSHHNIYSRPHVMHIDALTLGEMQLFGEEIGDISPQQVANLSSPILTPQAEVGDRLAIANGWEEGRFRFMIYYVSKMGITETHEIICGYTSHSGLIIEPNGNAILDPEMDFYINSVVPIRVITNHKGNKSEVRKVCNSFLQVNSAIKHQDLGFGKNDRVDTWSLSPSTVLNDMASRYYEGIGADGRTINNVGKISNITSLSDRQNANPSVFVAKVASSWKSADREYMSGVTHDKRTMLSTARGYAQDRTPGSFVFLRVISQMKGSTASSESFSYKNLTSLFPVEALENVTQVVTKSKEPRPVDCSNHLAGADIETISAVLVSNILPPLMMRQGIVSLIFTATNRTDDGRDEIIIEGYRTLFENSTLERGELDRIVLSLKKDISLELLLPLSHKGQIDYTLRVDCSVLGNTKVNVSFAGNSEEPFIIPTFADSLFNATITTNRENLTLLRNGFDKLLDALSNNSSNYNGNPSLHYGRSAYEQDISSDFGQRDNDFYYDEIVYDDDFNDNSRVVDDLQIRDDDDRPFF